MTDPNATALGTVGVLERRPVFHTPQRSLDQRMDALKRANDTRVKRAAMKVDIKAGDLSVVEILRDVPGYAATMKIMDLLMAMPKFGRVKASRVLTHCRVSQSKTLLGLSDRQRQEIINQIAHRDVA